MFQQKNNRRKVRVLRVRGANADLRSCWSLCQQIGRPWWSARAGPGPGGASRPWDHGRRCSPPYSRSLRRSSDPGPGSPANKKLVRQQTDDSDECVTKNNNGTLETSQKNLLSSCRSTKHSTSTSYLSLCCASRGGNCWVTRNAKEEARGESWYLTTSFSAVDIFSLTDKSELLLPFMAFMHDVRIYYRQSSAFLFFYYLPC